MVGRAPGGEEESDGRGNTIHLCARFFKYNIRKLALSYFEGPYFQSLSQPNCADGMGCVVISCAL